MMPSLADSIGGMVGLKAAWMGPMLGAALTGERRATPVVGGVTMLEEVSGGAAGTGGVYFGALITGWEAAQLLHPEGAGATTAPCCGGTAYQPGGGAMPACGSGFL